MLKQFDVSGKPVKENKKPRMKNMNAVKKGFTLIEILIVISIIGILTAMAVFSFASSQKQARDVQRRSDIKQYATSLEGFGNKYNGLYPQRPSVSGVSASNVLCADMGLTSCPNDPRNSADPTYEYLYQTDGTVSDGSASAVKYVLWAKLEINSMIWVTCSNGKSGTKTQTGFSVSGGNCPL